MKISTKGTYGLRAMVDLATYAKDSHVSLASIAKRQKISENYLVQIFSSLRKAGLVKSIKGAEGGYILAYHPSEITAGRVLRVLEGSLGIVNEEQEEQSSDKEGLEDILKKQLWNKVNKSINRILDNVTLEELSQEYSKVAVKKAFIYYI